MLNILMTGVGGQGTVLAAKVLAQAAQSKGWQVRTGETIGMAQRGGSVVSHIRMGNQGEPLYSSLLAPCSANLIIAFEPAEAVRVLPYLAPDGILVSATTGVEPVTATLSDQPYEPAAMINYLNSALSDGTSTSRFVSVNDAELCDQIGTRKALNMILLATALDQSNIGLGLDDLREAVKVSVKERFVALNLKAIDLAVL
ncbi:MAG: indolepyruvate oxidoreductase subunit beta [Raoultibacter sp.]|jgi:indolepyruvate ferredoxin oxidoreductase beta subunit